MRNLRSIFASFGAGTALCAAAALAIAVTGAVSSVGGGMSPSRTQAATLEIAPITPRGESEAAPEARVVVPSPAPDVARAAAPGPSGRRRAAQGTAGATDSGGRSSRGAEDATGRDGGAAVGETPRARAGDEPSQGGGGASSTLAGTAAAGDSAVRGTTDALADAAGAVAPPAAQPVRDAGSTTADAAGQTTAIVTRTVDAVVEAGATAGRTIDPVAARAVELKVAAPAPGGAPATAARAPVAAP